MRPLRLAMLLWLSATPLAAQPPTPSVDLRHGPLRVARDRRHLVHADGTPFFWLGDTAWELFHRLSREEVDEYLDDRRAKGFTVIQAVVLAELDGLRRPNAYGDTPLAEDDPARPNEAYFRHVDYVVDRAQALGLHIGMLPAWGDKWNRKWGVGPEIFTPATARAYGFFLGRRYRAKPVIWILGGDRNPESETHLAIVRAMADGIRAGGARQPMTYHPQGGSSSSAFFQRDAWLDLHMFQSGHGEYDIPNYRFTEADYALVPRRPVLDGEPRYENHPVNWDPKNGWFDDADVRQAAYWSLLSGAAGHTYGCHDIWQMWQPGREPISHARTPWREAMHFPGSRQMGYARRLFESRPFVRLVPDQGLLAGDNPAGAAHQRAARDRDGRYLMAYTPQGRPITVQLDRLRGRRARAYWFDPRTGAATEIGVFPSTGLATFDPPGEEGRGRDWVLVVDDAGAR